VRNSDPSGDDAPVAAHSADATPGKTSLIGVSIRMREVEAGDAPFILLLRLDPRLSEFVSLTDPDLSAQVEWIARYKTRPLEYYWIIESRAGVPLGTVRVYDVQPDRFAWGSWIIRPNSPVRAGIESALLVYDFAFNFPGMRKSEFEVRKRNVKVVSFHQRFGAQLIGEDSELVRFRITKSAYESIRPRYARFAP